MTKSTTPRKRTPRSEEPGNLPVPTSAADSTPAIAALTRLKEELAQQTSFGFTQITSELNAERRERQRLGRVVTVGLSGLGILVILATIMVLTSIGTSVRDTLALEMATLTSTTARTIRAGTEPVRETVDRQTEAMAKAAQLEQALVSVYGYEQLATAGSRLAFSELRKLAARTDDAGAIAKRRLGQIKAHYKLLELPQRGNITLGEVAVMKGSAPATLESLQPNELLFVMNSPEVRLTQVHRAMSLLWDKKIDKEVEREMWSILQTSDNLPSCIAICSLLRKNHGTKLDLYDFDGWRNFLAKRM
jgi:hypothetical protein